MLKRMGLMVMAIGLGVVAGCSLSTPYPNRALFTINVGAPGAGGGGAATGPAGKDVALRVRRIIAVPPFGGTAFVYRRGKNQLQTDYYNGFAAAPADLITAQLVEWLRAEHLFSAVADNNSGVGHQWALEGRLQELVIDTTGGTPRAVVTMEFVVLDDRDPAPRPLMERTYTEGVSIKGEEGAAAAWSAACRRIFERLSGDLAGVK
ncbi:MAG: ABC-type transport auxiliary lipoprotein family protein [Phycisphaerae bacterium]